MDATPYLDELEQQQHQHQQSYQGQNDVGGMYTDDGPRVGGEDGVAPRKRSRISMACERCRKRRTKCNGQRPTCNACLSVATPCNWPEIDMRKQRKQSASLQSHSGHINPSSAVHNQSVSPKDSNKSLSPGATQFPQHPTLTSSAALLPHNGVSPQPSSVFPFSAASAPMGPFAFPSSNHIQDTSFLNSPNNSLGLAPNVLPPQFNPVPSSSSSRPSLQQQQQPQPPQQQSTSSHSKRTQAGSQADPMALYYMRPQGKTGIFPGFEAWPLKMKGPKAAESVNLHGANPAVVGASGSSTSPPNMSGASPSSTFSMPTPGSFELGAGADLGANAVHGAPGSSAASQSDASQATSIHPEQQDNSLLFEPGTNMPRSDFLAPLVKLFFEHMGHAHFPFLSEQDLHNYIRGEASPQEVLPGSEPFLINAICAISARFSDDPRLQSPHGKHQNGAPFWDRAKAYVLPMLAIPCFNNVASLLLMAWFCFGQNADSLLWNFSGMAMRMAVDLGFHKEPLPVHIVDPRVASRDRILFWACLHMEIYLCYGVGRTFNLKMDEVTILEPTIEDLVRIHGVAQPHQVNQALSPFPDYCRLTRLLARIADKVNDCSHRSKETQPPSRAEYAQAVFGMTPMEPAAPSSNPSSSATQGAVSSGRLSNGHVPNGSITESSSGDTQMSSEDRSESPSELMLLEAQMTHIMGSLDSCLRFSAENLKRHSENKTANMLLHLHLWYHATIILLHRPPLIHPETSAARMSLSDRMEIVNHSAREIYGIISMVEAVDSAILWSGAFLNLPLYVGACAFVQDFRIRTGRQVSQNQVHNAQSVGMQGILANVAATNFTLLRSTLQLISERWHGVNWVRSVLEKRGLNNAKLSLKEMLDECYTFVTPDEMDSYRRLIQKATQSTDPPTLTDESISALFSSLAQPSGVESFHPDDFASAYSLAAMFPDMYWSALREGNPAF